MPNRLAAIRRTLVQHGHAHLLTFADQLDDLQPVPQPDYSDVWLG